MRADAIGIFWQDIPRKKGAIAREMPEIPDTGWKAPREFPNIAGARAYTVDVETYDPDLKKHGPGWGQGKGHIVGLAVGVPDGGRWYFPMRHEIMPEDNLDPRHVLSWAKDVLEDSQPKIGANLYYDLGWLREEGINLGGPLYDVQYAEALLRENEKVGLDHLGERYCGEGKTNSVLYRWCADFYGGNATEKQRRNIYRAPPCLVGPYAEGDVDLPFRVIAQQWPLLEQYGLMDLFQMECRLIRLMVEMRFRGVPINLDRAEQLYGKMQEELEVVDKRIKDLVGFAINVDSNESLAKGFDHFGIPYGLTPKSQKPSFTKPFLKSIDHELPQLVLERRKLAKLSNTFIKSYLLEEHINGRVHCQFHQLRSDSGGARSGRLSSSTPNFQNIPIRSDMGKLIRTAFVPEQDHGWWRKIDYSQIEYRILAHYAVGEGADEVRRRYNEDPSTDFHRAVQILIEQIAGRMLDRSLVKNVNFGVTYGMGEPGLARYINLSMQEARDLFGAIHSSAPFLKSTMKATMNEADTNGFITTILGRRSLFEFWVPGDFDQNNPVKPLRYDQAVLQYHNPRRAYIHKALNRRLQGSAADLMKKAMLDCWEAGLFDEIGVPLLTVHDELDFSVPSPDYEETFQEIVRVMETAIRFNVPVVAGIEDGPSWGEVEKKGVDG